MPGERVGFIGLGGMGRPMEVFGGRMAERHFRAGVEARLRHKDYGIVLGEARWLGVPLPVSGQVWQQLNALMANDCGRQDTASLLRVLERNGTSA